MMDALCVEAEFALLGFSTCRKVVFLWEWCVKVQRTRDKVHRGGDPLGWVVVVLR